MGCGESLSANTTGSYNTGSGLYVLRNNTTGEYNTAMGYEAGDVITTGSNNVIFDMVLILVLTTLQTR